jgi:regulator of ribosome biosynthesis
MRFFLNNTCRIFNCPTETSELGPVATLPAEILKFPREKRVPDAPTQTVWEKFAKDKGIKNKKRERMVYDEVEQDFRPRYGYKGANSRIEEHAIVEVKAGQDPNEDPWALARDEKKRRVEKNKLQQVRNVDRAAGRPGKKSKNMKIDAYGREGIFNNAMLCYAMLVAVCCE